jgi:predicted nucleic acid-binding Zn ribbon protein
MYCDVCGHLIRPGQRPLLTSSAADPTIVFVDVCSDECAVTVRAERNEAVRERVA